jgi:uncharacterized protein YjbI with pentapeptide repeats
LSYTTGTAAVVLDSNVHIFDAELTGATYSGATLTLSRFGGAVSGDQFSATGVLGSLSQGGNLVVQGVTIGTVTSNSGGTLAVTFNANASAVLVNTTMQNTDMSVSFHQVQCRFNGPSAMVTREDRGRVVHCRQREVLR